MLPFLLLPVSRSLAASGPDAAMALARAGHKDEAIARLRALLAAGSDPVVAFDLVALLQETGQSSEAAAVYERASPNQPPSWALLAATRAYRDLKQFERAATLARLGLARFPNETVWPILLALIEADQGKADQALATLQTPAAQRAPETERLLAHAYALRRANQPFDALRDYFAVLSHDPRNTEARSELVAVLRTLRAPNAAAQFAAEPAPLPLAADLAAAEVRWGTQDVPYDPRHRFDKTDQAIAALDGLIIRADAEGDGETETRLRFDRMVAYRDRVRMVDVVAEALYLTRTGHSLPAYAREAYADALLYLRHPEAARDEYEAVLKDDPSIRDARIGRMYASVEMEDFEAAYAQADELLKSEPVWNRYKDDPSRYPHDEFVESTILAAAARFFGDQPDQAWERLAPERDAAPANPFLRRQTTAVMFAREWPRAAELEGQTAHTLSPLLLSAQIEVADAALARNRFAEARQQIAGLAESYPENTSIQGLEDELAAKTGWQLEAEFRPSNEDGGGTFGNSGSEINASFRAYSPLLDDMWRLFGGYSYSDSHPPEGFVDFQRVDIGAQVILPDVTARAAVTESFGTLSRTGLAGGVDWSPSDYVSLGFAGERISSETPLRALLHDVTADSLSARFSYSWDEAHSVTVGGGWLPFTDGNERVTVDARYAQKIVAIPRFGLTVNAELYGSINSLADTPYYNPAADGSASIGLLAEHTIWRRYESSFVQALTLEGGWYGERDFKGGPVGTATYEQRWAIDPWGELVYGAYISERIYDGAGARVIGGFITLRRNI